jgi:hypothetical protein
MARDGEVVAGVEQGEWGALSSGIVVVDDVV